MIKVMVRDENYKNPNMPELFYFVQNEDILIFESFFGFDDIEKMKRLAQSDKHRWKKRCEIPHLDTRKLIQVGTIECVKEIEKIPLLFPEYFI